MAQAGVERAGDAMRLVPFEKIILTTNAPASRLVEMLRTELSPPTQTNGAQISRPRELRGWVAEERFSVTRNRFWPGPYAVCRGSFEERDGETVVILRFTLPLVGLIIGGFVLSLVALAAIGLFVAAWIKWNWRLLLMGSFAALMLLWQCTWATLFFWYDARRIREGLLAIISRAGGSFP
ncbi:MAG: hypothetical protein JXL80_14775 [Planctomycetes bacterium]|nr:hypothetical protein [Planctomycetota bacterium]